MQPNIIKSAMLNGLIMGVLFSINFLFSISKITVFALLSYVLIAVILIGIYRLTIRYRDIECKGSITFGKAFSFILLTFFYAALISSIVKYIYFQFINPGYLDLLLEESMKAIELLKIPIDDASYENIEGLLKPATFSLQYIWMNVLVGSLIGLTMAPFIKKDKGIFEEPK